jgi:hypothetical protein
MWVAVVLMGGNPSAGVCGYIVGPCRVGPARFVESIWCGWCGLVGPVGSMINVHLCSA